MPPKKTGLGKGLGALLPSIPTSAAKQNNVSIFGPARSSSAPETYDGAQLMRLPLNKIIPNPDQPRTEFDESALEELADSLRRHGLIQPLAVTRRGDHWMIVAGERRWRAASIARLETVPAVQVQCDDDRELLEFALVENLQREDLNPIEEARAYQALIKKFSLSQDEVATAVGKARTTVTNAIRLLRLPTDIQQDI